MSFFVLRALFVASLLTPLSAYSQTGDIHVGIHFSNPGLERPLDYVVRFQKALRSEYNLNSSKYPPQSLHLTLGNMTNVKMENFVPYIECIQSVASNSEPFDLSDSINASNLEILGRKGTTAVLVLENQSHNPLDRLAEGIRRCFHFKYEKVRRYPEFKAHISIGKMEPVQIERLAQGKNDVTSLQLSVDKMERESSLIENISVRIKLHSPIKTQRKFKLTLGRTALLVDQTASEEKKIRDYLSAFDSKVRAANTQPTSKPTQTEKVNAPSISNAPAKLNINPVPTAIETNHIQITSNLKNCIIPNKKGEKRITAKQQKKLDQKNAVIALYQARIESKLTKKEASRALERKKERRKQALKSKIEQEQREARRLAKKMAKKLQRPEKKLAARIRQEEKQELVRRAAIREQKRLASIAKAAKRPLTADELEADEWASQWNQRGLSDEDDTYEEQWPSEEWVPKQWTALQKKNAKIKAYSENYSERDDQE